MKRWIILAMIVIAVAAAAISWTCLPVSSSQPGVVSAADLGLLLLDTAEGVSVLGVQNKSLADQADIQPGDILLHVNGSSLSTAEALDNLLGARSETTLLIDLQRGNDVFCVKISLASIVY